MIMLVPIVASLNECLYKEVFIQIDIIFYNTPPCTFEPMYFLYQNSSKNLVEKYEECTLIILKKSSGKIKVFILDML
jgi:hypothetical protein